MTYFRGTLPATPAVRSLPRSAVSMNCPSGSRSILLGFGARRLPTTRKTWSACAMLLLIGTSAESAHGAHPSRTTGATCRTGAGVYALVTPRQPQQGQPLGVLFVAEQPVSGATIVMETPKGQVRPQTLARGGPPYWWYARIDQPQVGRYQLRLLDGDGATASCLGSRVKARPKPTNSRGDLWKIRSRWSLGMEGLYAAWIEKLFDAPQTERPSWTPLHAVLRDPQRNVLYGYLGFHEDGPDPRTAVVVQPDCADLPYFLRAYFSWKMGLPFAYRHCDRGSSRRPSRCGELRTNLGAVQIEGDESPAGAFSRFLQRQVSYVHSGSGRTAPEDDDTDLYPVPLTRGALRPGTVYVDPYGHLLVLARWVPQTDQTSGALYAVDGHPDLSVGRKRFWRGAFLFRPTRAGAQVASSASDHSKPPTARCARCATRS